MYEYGKYIYILLIFSHSYSQCIYTRKNVSGFFLHQQYLYLSPSTSKHHLVLSLQYSFPIRLGDDLKKQLPFRLKKCTDGGTWEKNPTKSHLHPRKQTWNLKIPPLEKEKHRPNSPHFLEASIFVFGDVYCFFSKGQCSASSCIWNMWTGLTPTPCCSLPVDSSTNLFAATQSPSHTYACHHPNKSQSAQQLATIHHLPLFHIPPPCVLGPKPLMVGIALPPLIRNLCSGYNTKPKRSRPFFWVDDSPTTIWK